MKLIKLLVIVLFFASVVQAQRVAPYADSWPRIEPIPKISVQSLNSLTLALSPRREVYAVENHSEARLLFESILPIEEIKRLRNGVEIPGLGTVYANAGARWQVEVGNPHLTRTFTIRHGGPMLSQEYRFSDWRDLKQAIIVRPFQRFITRISGER